MVLGQVLYLEWAQVHPFVPMNLLSPVLNPSAGCQGICPGSLLVTHAAAPCDNFKVFVHFPPRFLFISLGFQLHFKYFLCCILARISMCIRWADTIAESALSHYYLCSCLSVSTRL